MELAEHATKVMNTLDEGIKQLDNLDSFFQYLTNVGASHRKIPGFKSEYFWVSGYIFVRIERTFGIRWWSHLHVVVDFTLWYSEK